MTTDAYLLAAAILSSSFIGSWHCAAMCGPIACVAAKNKSLGLYHLGRGLSYATMGALGGYLGSFLLTSEYETVRAIAGFLFAAILVVLGLLTLSGRKFPRVPRMTWMSKHFNKRTPSFYLGLLSVFLPCGWLYSYVFAAAATRSPWAGALTMALFWLAGLPALSALSVFMRKSIQLAPQKTQVLAGLVLVGAGLYSLFSFYFLTSHCH